MIQHPTINMQAAIGLFHELMRPDSDFRVLRLLGEAKLGKSHMVTKVFPKLNQDHYGMHHAVLDLRSKSQTIPDILHNACRLLGPDELFPTYHAAYQEWINRPKVQVSGLQALLSSVHIKSEGEERESAKMYRHLTSGFVTDIQKITDPGLILLFDQVDDATETTLDWLMEALLVQMTPSTHLRVVVAGRSVPEALGSYAPTCRTYELQPVQEEEEYIAYCRDIGAQIEEGAIRVLAKAFDYKPGQFVDIMPKFGVGGTTSG